MKVIFLDVDGVLNSVETSEVFQGFVGIDDKLVSRDYLDKKLKKHLLSAVDKTNIILNDEWFDVELAIELLNSEIPN